MSLGIAVTKHDLDQTAGNIAFVFRDMFERAVDMKTYLDTQQVSDLVALGYTTAEANTLKSAFSDASQLNDIFAGTVNLTVAKDFRTFLKQLWGIGRL